MPYNTDPRRRLRPIRDLLCPDLEVIDAGQRPPGTERRRQPRFRRSLVGSLRFENEHHPMACVDVSWGGMQVVVPWSLPLERGTRATVHVRLGDQAFEDEFAVVQATARADGTTTLHLSL